MPSLKPAVKTANCHIGCGACCIAPKISSPIPGMPNGKAAGQRCVQLNEANCCLLFGSNQRPHVCGQFMASHELCDFGAVHALRLLTQLEIDTLPD